MASFSEKIKITIDVIGDKASTSLGKFRTDLNNAEGATGKFKVAASGAFDAVKANAGVFAVAAGAALVKFGGQAVDAFQETALAAGELRDKLGLTAEEASQFIEVAGDMGIEVGDLESTIGRMNREAENSPEKFDEIGAAIARNEDGTINVKDTFLSTVEALNQMPDAAARAAAGQEIFGRGWMNIAEMVTLGADGMQAALDAVETGKVISDEEVSRARRYRDAMDALNGVVEELSVEIGGSLVPALASAAENATTMVRFFEKLGLLDLAAWTMEHANATTYAARAYTVAAGETNLWGEAVNHLTQEQYDQLTAAQQSGASAEELAALVASFRKETDAAAESAGGLAEEQEASAAAAEEAEAALDAQTEAIKESVAALQENIEALEAQIEAQYESVSAGYALEQAQFDLTESVDELTATMEDGESTLEDIRKAQLNVISSADGVAQSSVRLAEEQAKASGKTLTATERTDAYNTSLLSQAATLTGPARAALLEHIGNVNGIPAAKMTEINAAIDAGDLALAESLLNSASRTRDTSVRVGVDENSARIAQQRLDLLARPLSTTLSVNSATRFRQYASGTPYHPGGPAVINEHLGGELVDLPMGSSVTRAAKSAGMPDRGGSPSIVYVTQNFPAGMRPSDVIDAQRKFARRNGPS